MMGQAVMLDMLEFTPTPVQRGLRLGPTSTEKLLVIKVVILLAWIVMEIGLLSGLSVMMEQAVMLGMLELLNGTAPRGFKLDQTSTEKQPSIKVDILLA